MRAIAHLAIPVLACSLLSGQNPAVKSQSAPTAPRRTPGPDTNDPPTVRPEDKCTIRGVVLNQITGEAVKRAALSLRRVDRGDGTPGGAVSESDGTFTIANLDPGRYMLSATKNGFANQQYGARGVSGGAGSAITLSPGQTMQDLTFKLVPHGVITGRVIDDDGEPMSGISIQVLRSLFRQGKRQTLPMNQASTNDLGEYRIFGLAPGRYALLAKHGMRGMMTEQIDLAYQPVYYPNAAEPGSAVQLQVTPGQTIRGIDFTLRRTQSFRISGQIVNMGRSQDGVGVMLMPKGAMGFDRQMGVVRNGKFTISGVIPGSYILSAEAYGSESGRATARLPITVSNSNLENLQLAPAPGVDITGHVVEVDLPDQDPTKPASAPVMTQNVWLEPREEVTGMGGSATQVGDGGKFVLKNVGPLLFNVNFQPLPADSYIKAIRFGDADVTDQGLDFSNGATTGEITIVISGAGGGVDGTVENSDQKKAAAILVVAVPAIEKRTQSRLFKTASTDQNGHFELKGLAPGDYDIFAFEQIEPGAYQDSELLKPLSGRAQRVTVKEKSKETVSLKAIPAELTKAPE